MPKRKKSRMKLPNGYGSIVKLTGNRRKKYGVYITVGWNENGTQLRDPLGYVETYEEGLAMLAEYHKNPYDLTFKDITYEQIYNILEPEWKAEALSIEDDTMGISNYKNLVSAWSKLKPYHSKKVLLTKKIELQSFFNSLSVGKTTKGYVKNVLTRIATYCIDYYELPINKNIFTELKIGSSKKSTMHIPFEIEDINKIKIHKDLFFFKTLLVLLYSGMRPMDFVTIKNENVFLENNYMVGGSKTEAGKDRYIPIHPEIKPLIEELYHSENEYLLINPNTGRNMTSETLCKNINKLLKKFNIKHVAYDTRHTFATYAKECGISDIDIKLILGHSLNDITYDVYIHVKPEYLFKQICKLVY